MTRRINITVHDDVWRFLRDIPQGQRSRAINDALRAWVRSRRRSDAVADMDRLRNATGTIAVTTATGTIAVTTEEVVRWVREDREAGH